MPLHTVFSTVLNMSITASIAIVVILPARVILKRAPKIFSYVLWAVVLFRLLCPVSLPSGFSLMGLFQVPATETGRMEYVSLNVPDTERPAAAADVPASDFDPTAGSGVEPSLAEGAAVDSADLLVPVVSIVWICGVAAMLMFHLFQLMQLRRKLVGSIPLSDRIYLADHISTPFVIGFIRPKIYLPSAISESEQSYIIQHEKHHIRRCDHVIKLLAFAAMCVHWFNPLVWLAFALSGKDMEMSCDEAVLKQMGRDIRADYSASLLQFSTGKRVIVGTPLAFGEGDTRARIVNIMKYKKPTMIVVVLAVMVCAGLTACLSSNPQPDAGRPPTIGALKEEDIGKTLLELKNEHPEGTFMVRLDGFPDSAAICFGEPAAEYVYYFFGTQSGDAEKATNEYEDQLKCAGFVTTANILFPDMEEEMSFEAFFSLIGVDDYEYLFGDDAITGEGWLRFTYHGMEVMVNTNEAAPGGGWNFTGAEIVKSNAPVSVVDPELSNANSDLADAVMFD